MASSLWYIFFVACIKLYKIHTQNKKKYEYTPLEKLYSLSLLLDIYIYILMYIHYTYIDTYTIWLFHLNVWRPTFLFTSPLYTLFFFFFFYCIFITESLCEDFLDLHSLRLIPTTTYHSVCIPPRRSRVLHPKTKKN